MGADASDDGLKFRARKYDDEDVDRQGDNRRKRHRRDEPERRHRRDRSRSRDQDTARDRDHKHTSSRSDPKRERSRSRDRARDTSKDRGRRRESSRDRRSRRHRHRDRDGSGGDDSDSRAHRKRSPKASSSRNDRKLKDDKTSVEGSVVRRGGPLPSQLDTFAVSQGETPEQPKEQPNYGSTGRLAAASNSVVQADGTSVTLKYHEPAEARKPAPRDQWKLFVFKGADIVDTIDLSARSCWLIGRELTVVDLAAEHPSISKQHAVIQFRHLEKHNEFGDRVGKVKPYLIDLESANGTRLNGDRVPESRYLELRPKDMIQFGESTREYVLMLPPRD